MEGRGTDELAQTLNEYLCDILEEFLIFGGDILKFAGDAVLVLWRTPPQEVARTISLVLHCSRQIQKKYGRRDTDVGQKIQLKIGISAGTMSLLVFGDESWQHFCIFGPCLAEVRDAEEVAGAGEVVLSATCWELCEQHRLRTKHLAGTRAVQAGGWDGLESHSEGLGLAMKEGSVTGMDPMPWSECQDALRKLVQDPMRHRSKREGAMRPALLLPSDLNAKDVLRKYIPVAALGKLDAGLPMDLLSELRPVTCIFVQLQLAAGTSSEHLSTVLKEASRVMLEILSPHKGHINKVLLCDKGCTFLCVLGLPGNKLPCESLHALQSALEIFNSCSTMLKERETMSVAVTRGTMFCGVTGHPLRHKYTVLGQKVNLAARMMVHYPGLVSCDAVTYAASWLPASYFKELPEREMKSRSEIAGMGKTVGQRGSVSNGKGLDEGKGAALRGRQAGGPVTALRKAEVPKRGRAGRKQETDLFVSCLNAYRDSGQRNILAVEGTMGCGKSHLLSELASLGQDAGHSVVALELLEIDMRQPFSAIRMLMARALGLQDCESRGDRQRVLKTKLQGTIEESSYCLLNDIFCVKFPISDNDREMDETQRKLELHSTRLKVLEKTLTGDFGIFVIDNAHFIDPDSWFIMSPMLQTISLFMVMSLAPGYEITESFRKAAADNAMSQKITYLHLDKLKASVVMQKVCNDLGVVSIPRDLVRFLIRTSSGIPYYCEELLRCLRANDMLQFCTRRQSGKAKDNWESLITSAVEASSLAATWSSDAGNDGRVCLLRPGVTLENTALPIPLKEIALTQLDRMQPLTRMVVKFAAIIGPVFTTQLLSHILPTGLRTHMNSSLDELVSDNILKRLKNTEVPEDVQDPTEGPATSSQVESGVQRPSPSTRTEEQQPGVLAFCVPLLQKAAYELWPERQRVALHGKCAAFLEQHAHKCRSCGQGEFVAFHHFAVTSSQDGGSCRDPADGGDSCSWEALVLAGEELKRDRTHATGGTLCTVLHSPGPPGAQGCMLGIGWEEVCRGRAQALRTTTADFAQRVGTLARVLEAQWESESSSSPGAGEEVSNPLFSLQMPQSSRLSRRRKLEGEQTTELPDETDRQHNGTHWCECRAIVESVLVPLARHYVAMGDADRAFYYLLECAAAYLHVSNSYMALMKLNEAEVLRKMKATAIACFEEATFFSLKGQVCWCMQRLRLAETMMREALSLLRRNFPETSPGAFVKAQVEKLPCVAYVRAACLLQKGRSLSSQEVRLACPPPCFPPALADLALYSESLWAQQFLSCGRMKRLAWLLQQSCCLSLLERLFSLEGTSSGRRFSRLAARMKANMDRALDSCWTAELPPRTDLGHRQMPAQTQTQVQMPL
ncbi:adenylate cyclase type 10-like [Chroicocephalus ridibundus]|uniref:adenylate cyclase type 10-like n=1 Tax=Chroicocephalus ridibundus TaxID=1192867 RepID=UPI002FDE312D